MPLPSTISGWAAKEKGAKLTQIEMATPKLSGEEILIEVQSCGICHSDIHLIDNDWMISNYPLVPGHEIIGKVVATGSSQIPLKEGIHVGVGWQRSACQQCEPCLTGRDNMCVEKKATCVDHWGGYANYHVCDWRYAFPLPEKAQSPEFAPLLCGGITVFSPFCEFLATSALRTARVGIVGIGGLGHLAIKFAHALGCEVTAFSSSPGKQVEALQMGADRFVASTSPEAIEAIGPRLDLLLVTVNVDLPWQSYLETLRVDGTLCFVGIPPSPVNVPIVQLLDKRRRIAASPIGGRFRMAQMLEFVASRQLNADIEVFQFDGLNEALTKVRENKVHYRAVVVR